MKTSNLTIELRATKTYVGRYTDPRFLDIGTGYR
jgi:hypothetical protein